MRARGGIRGVLSTFVVVLAGGIAIVNGLDESPKDPLNLLWALGAAVVITAVVALRPVLGRGEREAADR